MLQMMQLLELIQGNRRSEGQQALGYAGLERQGQHDQAQDMLARLGLTQQEGHQKALEALGLRQAEAQEAQHRALLAHQNAALDQQYQLHQQDQNSSMQQEFLRHFLPDPQVPWEKKLAAIQKFNPAFAEAGQAMHQGGINAAIESKTQEVRGPYEAYNKDHNYPALQTALGAIRSTTPTEVYNGLPWGDFNGGMTPKPVSALSHLFGGSTPEQFSGTIPHGMEAAFGNENALQAAEALRTKQQADAYDELQKKRAAELFLRKQAYQRDYASALQPQTF